MVRRGMAAALCAAALVLVGCSDDPPKPKPLDPPSGSESPTPPPTSEPPKAQTPEEAIRTWIQVSYDVQTSGETGEFRSLGRDCKPCDKFADRIDSVYADGGWVKPPLQKLKSTKLKEKFSDGRRVYRASVLSPPWSYKEHGGAKVTKERGGPSTLQIELRQFDGSWLVTHYGVLLDGANS